MPAAPRRVVLAANSSWNIVNFRSGLIRALKTEGYEPIVLAPVDPAAEQRMDDLGVERIVIEIERSGLNPFADFALLLEYRRLLKRLRPIAYLGFTIKPNIYGCIAARQLRIASITNISGLGTAFIKHGPLQALVTSLYRFALRRTRVVFFQNPDDLALFVGQRIVRADQARLLPGSGVDIERFTPAPLPSAPVTFLFIGRLLGDKGVREFVDAARHLSRELTGVRFQLLGPLDEGNRSAIARSELDLWVKEGSVEYLGATDDVRPYIEKATAVVLPSYREGLPRSLLEAAAMGRPLVTTDVPGCREVVEHGVNGFLCEVRSSDSLANAMKELVKMPSEKRAQLGAASRWMVEERFSQTVVIRAYLDALGKFGVSRS